MCGARLGDGVDGGRRRDHVEQGLAAQVAQQHEAQRLVPGQHVRRIQPGLQHQPRHLDEGPAVFLGWWRVHDDVAALARCSVHGVNPEITAKAGIGRGQPERGGLQLELSARGGEPAAKSAGACRVGPVNKAGGHDG